METKKSRKTHLFCMLAPLGACLLLLIFALFDLKTLAPLGKTVIFRLTTSVIFGGIALILLFHILKRLAGLKIATIIIYILAFSPLLVQNLSFLSIRHTLSAISELSDSGEPIIIPDETTYKIAKIFSSEEHPVYRAEEFPTAAEEPSVVEVFPATEKLPESTEKIWYLDREELAEASDEKTLNFISDGYHTAVEIERD